MAVISVSVTQSAEFVVDGVPRYITISTNISANIFYTLDGSTPDLFSSIYIEPIALPSDQYTVNLKIFATDGVNSSDIISYTYTAPSNNTVNKRFAHAGTTATPSTKPIQSLGPFGSGKIIPNQKFLGTQEAGNTSENPLLPHTPSGFDGQGNATGFTNEPLIGIPTQTQPILLTESNAQGERGPGIGTLPKSTIQAPTPPQEYSEYTSERLFDPKALVIFQDFTKPDDPTMPFMVNSMYFSLDNPATSRDGAQYFNAGGETAGPTGSFLRQHYNPKEQTVTYYYRDSISNRWIISKTPYTPSPEAGKYYNMVFSRNPGAGFVFSWQTFKTNYLW